jgi:hypothetical protein
MRASYGRETVSWQVGALSIGRNTMNVQCFKIFCYAVPHNNRCILLFENINLYFVLQQMFEPMTILGYTRHQTQSYFFLHPMPYIIHLFVNVTVLHHNVFTKAVYSQTSNWLLVG